MVVVPSRMGRLNKRSLLDHLHRIGLASRADLAKSLGISQPTAGKIADELLEMGVFEEVTISENVNGASHRSRAGRPARMLRLNRSRAHFLVIQLGIQETHFALASIGVTGEDKWAASVKTPGSAKDWVRALRATAGKFAEKKFRGVLLSVPGLVDERNSRVLYSPNLHWTEQANLTALIRQVWKAPVILVQEEHALALGHQAAGPSGEDFFLVDFGDGVGGAVVIGRKLHSHPLPISGELGHTPIIGNKRRCGCGATGCLETLASKTGLLRSFSAAAPGKSRNWEALAKSISINGIEPWLAETLDAIGGVIAGALNVLGLRRVVITGELNELPPAVLEHLSKAISRGTLWARFGEIKVEGAPRRRVAGLVAAGLDRLILPMTESNSNETSVTNFHAA
jgi:N-acetylglucosamine repressor